MRSTGCSNTLLGNLLVVLVPGLRWTISGHGASGSMVTVALPAEVFAHRSANPVGVDRELFGVVLRLGVVEEVRGDGAPCRQPPAPLVDHVAPKIKGAGASVAATIATKGPPSFVSADSKYELNKLNRNKLWK